MKTTLGMLKLLIVAGTLALLGWMTLRHAVIPFRVNIAVASQERLLREALRSEPRLRRAQRIREVGEAAAVTSRLAPRTVHSRVLAAIANLSLSQNQAARTWYCDALRLDRRPEIYFGLAEAELALGRTDEAIGHLAIAGMYRPGLLDAVPNLSIREEAYNKAQAGIPVGAPLLRNEHLSPHVLGRRKSGFIVPGWEPLGAPSTEIRGYAGEGVLRVEAARGEGIFQGLVRAVAPASVRVETQISIEVGDVGIIAGPKLDIGSTLDPVTTGPGHLQALSKDCPVRYVGVICRSERCVYELHSITAAYGRRGICRLATSTLIPEDPPAFEPEHWFQCRE